jgi:hypothetical protein
MWGGKSQPKTTGLATALPTALRPLSCDMNWLRTARYRVVKPHSVCSDRAQDACVDSTDGAVPRVAP